MSEHHLTKQNLIRPVEYSCIEVSSPCGVPQFVVKWMSR